MAKQNTYINTELDWAEQQLEAWKSYIDTNPINELKDRVQYKETRNGGVIPMVVATVESQIKSIRDTMKEFLSLLEVVNKLREAEEKKKIAVRGDTQLGAMAQDYLDKRK